LHEETMDLGLYILVLRGWKSVFGVLAPFEVHFYFYLVILFIDHLLDSTDQLWRRKYDSLKLHRQKVAQFYYKKLLTCLQITEE